MKNKMTRIRRLSQIIFATVFCIVLWRSIYPFENVFAVKLLFYLDPLVSFGVALSERVFSPILILSVFMVILTLVLGKFFCGWVCPLGSIIDFIGYLRTRVFKIKKELLFSNLRYIKFFILIIVVVFAVFGIQIAWVGDPVTIAARFISMTLIPFIVNLNELFFRVSVMMFRPGETLLGMYRWTQIIFGGIRSEYFMNSFSMFLVWFVVVMLSMVSRRFWCRNLCPLGALYAFVSRFAFLSRLNVECTGCKRCISDCRMGAITDGRNYIKEECVLCMDCLYNCTVNGTGFVFRKKKMDKRGPDTSRRNFLKVIGLSMFPFLTGIHYKKKNLLIEDSYIIRPPGALVEKAFVDRCIRCGNCMRACVTNGLQPVFAETGLRGIWTPRLIPEIGECEYQCMMCTKVCPTGAIPSTTLEKKKNTKLGLASVYRERCLAWIDEEQCIVCEEHCPIPAKAIKLINRKSNRGIYYGPQVDKGLCIGCGTCQRVCPTRPHRAIIVDPKNADRT